MKVLKCIVIVCMVIFCFTCRLIAKPIIAGYDAVGRAEHLESFSQNGLNTHFRSVRIAPKLTLELDSKGQVVITAVSEGYKQSLIDYCQLAEKNNIDVYFISGFHKEHLEQLENMGPYSKAVIQGPTRYHSPGEKPAPGPLEEKYWLGQLLCEAKFVAELSKICPNLKGFIIDVEMYAGQIMWRTHCSFDDQTFNTVMSKLDKKKPGLDSSEVAKENRHQWLLKNGLLEEYFAIEEQLVKDIASKFRKQIDLVNPDFQLGVLTYEANWFYDGWINGLASSKATVLICSETEYRRGLSPSAHAKIHRLKNKGIKNIHYLPGLWPKHYSPKQLAIHAKRCIDATGGYWIFTTYSFWQPEPEKLWGPYVIQAPAMQYWQELAKANQEQCPITSKEKQTEYDCPGFKLLTNNKYYPGQKTDLPVKVTYSVMPDVVLHHESEDSKLFNGATYEAFGTIAWHAKEGEEVSVVIDFSAPKTIQKIQLIAAQALAALPAVITGTVTTSISMDNKNYYPVKEEKLLEGRGSLGSFIYDDLSIRARFIKISMKADKVSQNSVWSVSEIAVWGN